MSDTATAHEADARRREPVPCAVLTVSDTRTAETDTAGPIIARHLEDAGHTVVERVIVADDADAILRVIERFIADPGVRAILTTGGTGIARRDVTVDVVRGLLTTELEGFGELFRMISYEQIQGAAMLSRAVGGLVERDDGDTIVFAMPGSPQAAETAMGDLIAPQLAHLASLRTM